MKKILLICAGFSIAVIVVVSFLLHSARSMACELVEIAYQTVLLEGFIVLAVFFFLASVLISGTFLSGGLGWGTLFYGSSILFEILKALSDRLH